jgi:hypothetical protein
VPAKKRHNWRAFAKAAPMPLLSTTAEVHWGGSRQDRQALAQRADWGQLSRIDQLWPVLAERHGDAVAVEAPHANPPECFSYRELSDGIDTAAAAGQTVSVSQGKSVYSSNNLYEYTTDGGAGGAEILNWYNTHPGSFWVYLAYDNYPTFGNEESSYNNLNKYNEIIEVFFSDFNYSVVKRGGTNFDLWNVSLSLEEA